ncbi:MAG: hypothetical protein MK085_12105 [Phycisphaerales bacterium]|nr:hypothetical protein [Phycisphaerales bacterium]
MSEVQNRDPVEDPSGFESDVDGQSEQCKSPSGLEGSRIAFGYKGGRDYVHGTDQYMAFRSLAMRSDGVQLKSVRFHGLLRGDGIVEQWQSDQAGDYRTGFVLESSGASTEYGVRDAGDPTRPDRPYPESDIVDMASIFETGASLQKVTEFDGIEEAVALIKAWCNEYLPVEGKWLFARIDMQGDGLPVPSVRVEGMEIELANVLAKRFARFHVNSGDVQALVTFGVER